MTRQEQFFYDNAGWSYNPATQTEEQGRIECAKRLAQAELEARAAGISYSWDREDCDCEEKDHNSYYCMACDGDTLVASLGMICGPTREYRRVIEAELALEWSIERNMAETRRAQQYASMAGYAACGVYA